MEKQKEQTKKEKIWSITKEFLVYAAIIVTCVFLVPNYVMAKNVVSGESMENTLHDKEQILTEMISYRFGEPKRFDIIVFYHFFDNKNTDKSDKDAYEFYVKRIIGLPGENVRIEGDTIYINGEPLEEHYGKDSISDSGRAEEEITLGEDEYFVLGDNREVSIDSRSSSVGNVKRDWILGKVCARVYPFNKIGSVK
ncbi:MAG: signal peptidase I [Lachnospiraceae bacterium]|nr:signal peptidase I [Lachnospiraceae bacterium]